MKTYRIYVYNQGVYNYVGTGIGKLSDILIRCKEYFGKYGGYIKSQSDDKILRRF